MILFLKSIEDNIDEKIGFYLGLKNGKKYMMKVRYFDTEEVQEIIEI